MLVTLAAIGLWGHRNHWGFAASDANLGAASPAAVRPVAAQLDAAMMSAGESAVGQALEAADSRNQLIRFPSAQSVSDLGIRTARAERRHMVSEASAAGVVTCNPARFAQLSSRVTGTVWRVEKRLGQEVRSGDVLAVIEALSVGQAKADFLHALADVRLRQGLFDRLRALTNGEVAGKLIFESETELRKARVDLFNSQQALISLGLPIKLDEWQSAPESELQRRVKFLGLSNDIIATLDPEVTTASLLPLYAPFDGVVVGRDLTLGEVVSPSQSRFEIADVSKMWIVLNVREEDAEELELGQKVLFTAGKATVTSALSWMSTAVDEKTRTLEVRCEVDNPQVESRRGQPSGKRLLRANVFGLGKIELRESPAALAVPVRAVQWDGSDRVVFVARDERTFEPRTTGVGIESGEWLEIVSGLDESESIVVAGSHILKAELQRRSTPNPLMPSPVADPRPVAGFLSPRQAAR